MHPDPARLGKRLTHKRREVGRQVAVTEHSHPDAAGMRHLRWPDKHALLVDPDCHRHVHDPEQLIEPVGGVDQRWMLGLRPIDPGARRFGAADVERHGDDLDALRPQLYSKLLPHGQVEATASPRCPRDHHHPGPTQRAQRERTAVTIRKL